MRKIIVGLIILLSVTCFGNDRLYRKLIVGKWQPKGWTKVICSYKSNNRFVFTGFRNLVLKGIFKIRHNKLFWIYDRGDTKNMSIIHIDRNKMVLFDRKINTTRTYIRIH